MSVSIYNRLGIRTNRGLGGPANDGLEPHEVARILAQLQAGTLPAPLAHGVLALHAHMQKAHGGPVSHAHVVASLPRGLVLELGGDHADWPALPPCPTGQSPHEAHEGQDEGGLPRGADAGTTKPAVGTASPVAAARAAAKRSVDRNRVAYAARGLSNQLARKRKKTDQIAEQSLKWRRDTVRNLRQRARSVEINFDPKALDEAVKRALASAYALAQVPAEAGPATVAVSNQVRNRARDSQWLHRSDALATPGPATTLHETTLRAHTPPAHHPPAFQDAT